MWKIESREAFSNPVRQTVGINQDEHGFEPIKFQSIKLCMEANLWIGIQWENEGNRKPTFVNGVQIWCGHDQVPFGIGQQ